MDQLGTAERSPGPQNDDGNEEPPPSSPRRTCFHNLTDNYAASPAELTTSSNMPSSSISLSSPQRRKMQRGFQPPFMNLLSSTAQSAQIPVSNTVAMALLPALFSAFCSHHPCHHHLRTAVSRPCFQYRDGLGSLC